MDDQLQTDIKEFVSSFSLKEDVRNKHFCVTGATGLIGSILIKCLLALKVGVKITAPVRDLEKAYSLFGIESSNIDLICIESLEKWTRELDSHFDYVVHCASPTNGKYMQEHPVDTFHLAYQTTYNLLDACRKHQSNGFVFVSSLEYYGQVLDDRIITEDVQGYVDASSPRSSYPMGKRAAEYLCFSFAMQYGVNAKIARLTQTFGAGVSPDDNRVFAQFARSVINGQDIVLHTQGKSAKPYCYTTDCVSAILYVLLKGTNGEAYNVANEDSYISVKDLAVFLKENFNPNINVVVDIREDFGYAPETMLRLSTSKLQRLGWSAQYGLKEMFRRLISSIK